MSKPFNIVKKPIEISLDFDLDTGFQFIQKVPIFSHLLPIKLYFSLKSSISVKYQLTQYIQCKIRFRMRFSLSSRTFRYLCGLTGPNSLPLLKKRYLRSV